MNSSSLPRGVRIVCLAAAVVWATSCGGGGSAPFTPATPAPTPPPTPAPTPTPVQVSEPSPEPTPGLCPPLTSWTSRIFNITDSASQIAETPALGGHVLIDSTPLFSGRECNAEHDNCMGRKCEDPRGGEWTIDGDSKFEIRENGYQVRVGPLKGGTHRWKVCARADAMDAEGDPLTVRPDACTQGDFFVPES